MKFQPTIDVYTLSDSQLRQLQRGQWVSAGANDDKRSRGVFCGVRPSGSVVVAWNGNAAASRNPKQYRKDLMNYGEAQP